MKPAAATTDRGEDALETSARHAEEERVPMRDGTLLATDVYLPSDQAHRGRYPVVLARVPYDKRGQIAFLPPIARFLNGLGYAMVAQDVRGKHRSAGHAVPFRQEFSDGADTLEWIDRQPWSDGRVALFGDSYYGYTALAAAASGHRSVRATIARVTSLAVERDWMFRDGVFRLQVMGEWGAFAWSGADLPAMSTDWSVRPLRDLATASGRRSDSLGDWIRIKPGDPGWRAIEGNPTEIARGIRAPVLFWGGWWDIFQRGLVADWSGRRPAGSRLLLSATDHEFNPRTDAPPEDLHANSLRRQAMLPTLLAPATDFLARQLLGSTAPAGAPVRWEPAFGSVGEGATWPPSELAELRLHLADAGRALRGPEGGMLARRPDAITTSVTWTHDPGSLVPSLDPDSWAPLVLLQDERDVEVRDDVLTFTSEPTLAPLDILGRGRAELEVASTAGSLQVIAKLIDVYPDGRAYRIVEGATHVADAREPRLASVDLGWAGYRLRPGHLLRLEIASSSFPRYLWHPGTDADPWLATTTVRNRQTLVTGSGHSCLVLPVRGSAGGSAAR